jgi:prepilin-type N-terminal cleavage/methylation domain-containing protein/prepilin-type processing-associated H-X9-DG protein
MKNRAFTLLELLVVIAIIAVLSSLALPVIGGMRARANQTACASNLRQVGTAMILFCQENDGQFPKSTHSAAISESWIFTLLPYLANVEEVRLSPGDPDIERRRQLRTTSYTMNEYLVVPALGPFGDLIEPAANYRQIPLPTRTVAAFLTADGKVTASADHTHSRNWKSWKTVTADIAPDRFRSGGRAKDKDRGAANYLFADGHVESHDAQAVKALVARGVNFALPPQTADEAALNNPQGSLPAKR